MTQTNIPTAITPHHRQRVAVVYVWDDDVLASPQELARLEAQRAQRRHAEAWGWPTEYILVLEGDLGRCQCRGENRPDFLDLLKMVRGGHVGLVLVQGFSRLTRDWDDVVAFLDLCRQTDTLLAVNGRLADCHDPDANLELRLLDAVDQHSAAMATLLAEAKSVATVAASRRVRRL